MKHGSLFSGIGGFDLAAEWMGWQNIFHCEWMPFPQKVLKHYWPEAISYHDITTTDFREHYGQLDILTGGFPCQPYSGAGKRLGKDDERHLWPHMLRAIREISPRWVVGENVRGLTNWNGGLVFDEVQADLESAGYEVLPFLLPAVAVNAPHRRDRIWFIAYAENHGYETRHKQRQRLCVPERQLCQHPTQGRNEVWPVIERFIKGGAASNTDLHGLQQRNCNNEEYTSQGRQYAQRYTQQGDGDGDVANAQSAGVTSIINKRGKSEPRNGSKIRDWVRANGECGDVADASTTRLQRPNWCEQGLGEFTTHGEPCNWEDFPTQSPICGGDDGLPAQLDGITFPKWRAESIKGYGNAIVPQVALQIFRAIEQYEAVTMPHSSPTSQTHKE